MWSASGTSSRPSRRGWHAEPQGAHAQERGPPCGVVGAGDHVAVEPVHPAPWGAAPGMPPRPARCRRPAAITEEARTTTTPPRARVSTVPGTRAGRVPRRPRPPLRPTGRAEEAACQARYCAPSRANSGSLVAPTLATLSRGAHAVVFRANSFLSLLAEHGTHGGN
jgi:hypothetical protein